MFHSIFCLNDLSILLDHNYTHIFICSPVHPKQNQVMCHHREPYRTPPPPHFSGQGSPRDKTKRGLDNGTKPVVLCLACCYLKGADGTAYPSGQRSKLHRTPRQKRIKKKAVELMFWKRIFQTCHWFCSSDFWSFSSELEQLLSQVYCLWLVSCA